MCEQCCCDYIWYSMMYCECQRPHQTEGRIKNPNDGADCDFFQSDDDP